MRKKQRFLFQALLLTAVSLLLRAVGVGAQVYISSRIGPEAIGVSSLIGSVSGFAVTLALSGIHLGCTRLISEGLGNNDTPFIHRTLLCAIGHALFFGILSCSILFSCSNIIGAYWLRDLRTIPSLRVLALSLPAIALSSCFSGYFVAVRRVWKSACVQVCEEILRIVCTVLLLSRMASKGLENALLALALANAIADILSCAVMLLLFLADRKKYFSCSMRSIRSVRITPIGRRLLSVTLPVATAAYARSGLITLEHMLIPIGLKRSGLDHSIALASYGTLHSMALPVILFPCALLSAFSGLLVPEMTEAHVRGQIKHIRSMMQKVFLLSLLFSIGTAGIMLCYSRELGLLLYGSEQAALYIRVLAPLIPIMYIDSATDAMLKGLGQQVYSMNVNIVDASLSVLLVWLLLPVFGIWGYVITIYFTELLNAALSIARLLTVAELRPQLKKWVISPLVAIIGATCLTRSLFAFLPSHYLSHSSITLTIQILICCFLYGLFVILLGSVRQTELRWLSGFLISETKTKKPTLT
ncbi:MAG: polysaccharide biosynthesis C-terminal domain-containing protein [Clostridia bacterium]|nr:polysaccharide biosynthesis C-terminal domain-containing protein [Clostridia bacterium]